MKKIYLSILIMFLFLCNSYGQKTVDFKKATEYFNQANEKVLAHDYVSAIAFFNEAIAINPKYAMAYYDRGIIKINILKDTEGACIDFKKASEFEFVRANEMINKFCQ